MYCTILYYTVQYTLQYEDCVPCSGPSCELPTLPGPRYHHSQCGALLCGGEGGVGSPRTSCLKFQAGTFTETSVTLVQKRATHLCWTLNEGEILLMGGSYSFKTTEIVNAEGTHSTPGFDLPYGTM